jgi:hypothetical protein
MFSTVIMQPWVLAVSLGKWKKKKTKRERGAYVRIKRFRLFKT